MTNAQGFGIIEPAPEESGREYRKDEKAMKGCLYGVGVGPGDPELMTLKAVKRLAQCQIIAVPDAERGQSTAYQIAQGACPEIGEREVLLLRMPMTHDLQALHASHRAAADRIEEELDQGRDVAFLTLGDPTVYATYIYVHQMVAGDGYPTEIVSGVTSFCAAAARLGISLAERGQMLHIVPSSHGIREALKLPGVKVLMKAGSKMEQVRQDLLEADLEVAMVENCGMPGERVFYGADQIPADAGYFSLIVAKDK